MSISERISTTTKQTAWQGQIPMEYVYTMGRAGERFFRAIKDKGQFMGAKCERCDIVYVPPRIYCEECLARIEDEFVEVSTTGEVHTFTFCCENMDGEKYDEPHIIAMVQLDGSDGGLVHYLGEVDLEDVYIGMPVEAVFKAKKDRQGDIHDIKYFRPVE